MLQGFVMKEDDLLCMTKARFKEWIYILVKF